MDDLQRLLSDHPDPIFIITPDQEISLANEAALKGCGERNPVGSSLKDLVFFADETTHLSPAYFYDEWLDVVRMPFQWSGMGYIRVILRKRSNVPSRATLQIVQNLIAVLLNRLRSPLTGIQGYADMIKNNPNIGYPAADESVYNASPGASSKKEGGDQNLYWRGKVYEGVQHLFTILDDLEVFHRSLSTSKHPKKSYGTHPEEAVKKILLNLSQENRNRIRYRQSVTEVQLNCNPHILETILSILIENAIENSGNRDTQIHVEITSPNCLTVTNGGPVIPEEILDRIFFPFVTSKANKLGLGLTLAQIFASQQHALLDLTENSSQNGITFTLCFPPE